MDTDNNLGQEPEGTTYLELGKTDNLISSLCNDTTHAITHKTFVSCEDAMRDFYSSKFFNFLKNTTFEETTLRAFLNDKNLKNSVSIVDILSTQNVSEEFIENYYTKDIILCILKYQKIGEDFIKRHEKDINEEGWTLISIRQKLSNEFIENNLNKFNFENLCKFQNLSTQFIDKYSDKINWELLITRNSTFSYKDLNYIIDKYGDRDLNWSYISWHYRLSEENILNNLEYLDFYSPLLKDREYKNSGISVFIKLKYGI